MLTCVGSLADSPAPPPSAAVPLPKCAWGRYPKRMPLTWPDLLARPRPDAPARVPYGPDPLQYAELWWPTDVPRGTILAVHGGCWQTDIATLRILDWACADLAWRGGGPCGP